MLWAMLQPREGGPAWMLAVSTVNPVNWVVQAERALVAGDFTNSAVLWGWVAASLLAAIGLTVGIGRMRRTG